MKIKLAKKLALHNDCIICDIIADSQKKFEDCSMKKLADVTGMNPNTEAHTRYYQGLILPGKSYERWSKNDFRNEITKQRWWTNEPLEITHYTQSFKGKENLEPVDHEMEDASYGISKERTTLTLTSSSEMRIRRQIWKLISGFKSMSRRLKSWSQKLFRSQRSELRWLWLPHRNWGYVGRSEDESQISSQGA